MGISVRVNDMLHKIDNNRLMKGTDFDRFIRLFPQSVVVLPAQHLVDHYKIWEFL
jgi:hypothetical protein